MSKGLWITLLIRLIFGLVFFVYGLDKITDYRTSMDTLAQGFDGTWLPHFIVNGFLHILPFLELGIGICFLIGYHYRGTLIAVGILMAILTFGLAVESKYELVSRNLVYFFIVLVGLSYSDDNRFAVNSFRLRNNKRSP